MIEITETDADISGPIVDILQIGAKAQGLHFSRTNLRLEATRNGSWLGGLTAHQGSDWLFVELLGVAETAQGNGVGRMLMEAAESHARAAGSRGVWVDTYSFQAPGFYERLGYTEFGRITEYFDGHDRIFYAKRLNDTA